MPEPRERELLRRLSGAGVSADEIRELLRDAGTRRFHVIRRVLAAHPRTPRGDALSLIPTLYWRDLAWISAEARCHPEIRRAADKEIVRRLPGLALSEKAELAEISGRGVISVLKSQPDASLVRGVLRNRLTIESDVAFMAGLSRDFLVLGSILSHPVWGVRASVRTALARNRFLPEPDAIALLSTVPIQELREICRESFRPASFLEGARKILSRRLEGWSRVE
jgi:hypothetical protein